MRLTRHAKNRLRFIARRASGVSESQLLANLGSATVLGQDVKGNSRLAIQVEGILLIVVVDTAKEMVVTIWRGE